MKVKLSTREGKFTINDVTNCYNDQGLYLINTIVEGKRRQYAYPMWQIYYIIVDET